MVLFFAMLLYDVFQSVCNGFYLPWLRDDFSVLVVSFLQVSIGPLGLQT